MSLRARALAWLAHLPGARPLWLKFPVGGVRVRVEHGIFSRPHYAYGVYRAALQAKQLGLAGVTVMELGVAGGNGLIALESLAAQIGKSEGVVIRAIGIDSGAGMPPPEDYRDLPHVWEKGFYQMDEARLRARLNGATLVVGEVGEALPALARTLEFPIGFIAFDLDYYSSTVRAFRVFDESADTRLPRVYCYMDDVTWPEHALHCEYIGELAAIAEFNRVHATKKIAKIANLMAMRLHREPWCEGMYALHDFEHPLYGRNLTAAGEGSRQKHLMSR